MLKLVLLRIRRNIGYSIGMIIKTALSVMLVLTVIQLGSTISSRYRVYLMSQNCMDFEVRNLSSEQIAAFQNDFLENNRITSVKSHLGFIKLNSDVSTSAWLTAGTQRGLRDTEHVIISEGRFPEENFEIALEASINNTLPVPYKIGDEITAGITGSFFSNLPQSPKYTFKVCGFVDNTGLTEVSKGRTAYAVVSIGTAEIIASDNSISNPFFVDVISNSDLNVYDFEKITSDIERAKTVIFPNYEELKSKTGSLSDKELEVFREINGSVIFNQEKYDIFYGQSVMRTANFVMNLIAVFIALTSAVLLFNGMNINLLKQVKQWGSMRAIGLSRRQFFLTVMLENAVNFLSGGTLGLAAGTLFSKLVNGSIASALIKAEVPVSINIGSYIAALAMAGAAIMLSAAVLCKKSAGLTPNAMMNYSEDEIKSIIPLKFRNARLLIGTRQVIRRRTETLTLCAILIICNIVFSTLFNAVLFIELPERNPKSKFSDVEIVQDFNGRFKQGFTEDTLERIGTLDGTKAVYAVGNGINYSVNDTDSGEFITVFTYNDALFEKFCTDVKIDISEMSGAIAVSVGNKQITGLQNISVTQNDDTEITWYTGDIAICGTAADYYKYDGDIKDDNEGIKVIINEKLAGQIYGSVQYNDVFIETDKGFDEVISSVNPIISDYKDYRYVNYSLELSPDLKQLVAILLVATFLSLFIGFVLLEIERYSVKSNLTLYSKEYAVYRALGASLRDVKCIIFIEAIIVSALSAAVASVVSLPLNILLTNMIFSEAKINAFAFATVPLINMIIYTVISIVLSRQLSKQSINELIRCE